jgi:uncharacterized protein YndB with AHSA1/START domain
MNDLIQETDRPSARLSRRLAHPRDKVFRAWTDPALVMRWFGGADEGPVEVAMDCRNGGAYAIIFAGNSRIEGIYLTVAAPERLVFTWCHVTTLDDGAEKRSPESRVTVTFEDIGGETALTVLHERLSGEAGRAGVSAGWVACFEKIEALLRQEG